MGLKKIIDLDLLDRFLTKVKELIPTKTSDLTNDSGYMTGMTILSYGTSTWADFIEAYNDNKVVYCRASSNSNPATGSQTRMAFMAYVNNQATPTNVEFQYYRSVNQHTNAQQGDQVFVYKLDKNSGWSVTTRDAFSKVVAGTGLSSSYANSTITLTNTLSVPDDVVVYLYVNGSRTYSDNPTGSFTVSSDAPTMNYLYLAYLSEGSETDGSTYTGPYLIYGEASSASYETTVNDLSERYSAISATREYHASPEEGFTITMTFQATSMKNGVPVLKRVVVSGEEGYSLDYATVSYSEIPVSSTTYESKAAVSGGTDVSLVTTGEKYIWNNKGTYSKPSGGIPDSDIASAATWNAKGNGTITGITMNGASKGTSGVVNLGTVITSHQDISGKADKSATVSNVAYDSTNKKITKTINGTTSDVVSAATLKSAMSLAKGDVGLGNVDNVKQYSVSNPPPYPVTSVNGSTGAVTVSVPSAGTASPKMDGTAAVGSSTKYAKEDHVHPVDTSRAPVSHTHSADNILGGYLNIHPENSPTLIPFMHNDIAHLLSRGGSAVVKYDNTQQSVNISAVFDGSGSYWAINPTGITTIVIELTLHKSFGYSNWIYVDFGSAGWRAKSVAVDVINTNYADDVWTNKYQTTSNAIGHVAFSTSHAPVGASNSGAGFNKIRFTFSVWATSTIFRIAQLGIYNYGSLGLRETYMSRGVDDAVFRSITPNADITYNLGWTSNKWNHVYTKYLNDTEIPASPKFTDTTALGSMTGTLGVDHGGTGKTNATDAANTFMNALGTGSSTPVDADYYISQYVGGGTTTTTYHRRPMSALWEYIKGKISSVLGLTASSYGGSAAKVNNHTVAVDVPSNAKFTDTTYESKAAASGGTDVSLVTTGEKATWNAKTSNVGTITGINMNGASKGTSGVVDLGTVITSHQDISGKADKSATVSNVAYDSTNKKITKTINGTTSDVVTAATLKSAMSLAKGDVGLGNVDNVKQYSASNPPPYPVTSVNGATGAVNVTALYADTTRPDSANGMHDDNSKRVRSFLATSAMTTAKPPSDAHVLHFNWDNGTATTGTWDSQLAIAGGRNNSKIYVRGQNNGTWQDWATVYDTRNKPSKSDVGLGNVENKSSATIRGELTKANVTTALGYTPPTTDTTYSAGDGLIQNGTTFSDHRGIEYIRGTWTATSGTWTGVSTDTELYDGKQIILYMPFAGSGNATLNLTLAGGGTTGAKNVYFESTTRFTTQKGQNSQLHLIYHDALTLSNGTTYQGWWYVANRDQTINYQMRHSNNILALEAIPKYHLACGTASGYKKVVSGVTFDVSYPLLITSAAWTANTNYTSGFFEYQDQNIRNAIAALGSSYAGLTAKSMVYLVGTLSGTTFTVDSSLVTCTVPDTANGKAYIPLGIAYSTYQFYFYSQRLVYEYSGGSFHEVAVYARDAATINGRTVAVDVPSGAKFTDTTYESKTAASGGTDVSLVTTGEKYTWNNKQNALVSGTNIKTINGNSLLGSGNLSVSGLPVVTSSDNDKVLKVVNGAWAAAEGGGGSSIPYTDAILHVKAPIGSSLTFTKDSTSERLGPEAAHPNADGIYGDWYYSVASSNYGAWQITAALNNHYDTTTISPSEARQYDVLLRYTMHLFDNGDQCTAITGGWKVLSSGSSTITDVVIRWGADAAGNAGHRSIVTTNKINPNGRTILKIKFMPTYSYYATDANYRLEFGVSNNNTTNGDYFMSTAHKIANYGQNDDGNVIIESVDISDYKNTEMYIRLDLYRCAADVYEVWMEW